MEIGNLIGGRDHTTVMHGVEKITTLLSTNESLRGDIENLRKRIYG
jgi:chromosomal replication initiator protein